MGVAEKTEITREMLIEYITHYKEWSKEIAHYHEQMQKVRPAASTAKYGIEASMPRGSGGGHSDPTFLQATSSRVETYIALKEKAVRTINTRRTAIKTIREKQILDLLIEGLTLQAIAEVVKVSTMTVQRSKEKILDLMLEGK